MSVEGIELSISRPARHKYCILLCADENYECFAFALINQIVEAHPNLAADICFVSEHEARVPQSLSHLPVRLGQIAIDRRGITFPEKNHVTFSAYVSHFAVTALADTYDRILYLDADIMISGNDLPSLFGTKLLEGHTLGAVRDRFQQLDMTAVPQDCKNMGIPYFPYFNTGVFLVDTKEWVSQNVLERMLDTIRDHSDKFSYTDQSAINLTLRGSWTELSWHWNFIYLKNVLFYLNRVKPTVIHFAGSQKPWFVDAQIVPRRFASGYRDFLAKHYPDSLQSGVLPVGRRKRFFFARLLVSSLRVVAKLRAYHLRFQDHTVARDPWK